MTINEIKELLSLVSFPEYTFELEERGLEREIFLSATYVEQDIISKKEEVQRTRKWFISRHAVKSEIVQTAFKCILTSFEHRAREHFTYKGKRVYGPHYDVDKLADLCSTKDYVDVRPTPTTRTEGT